MVLIRTTVLSVLLLLLFSCGDPKPPRNTGNTTADTGSGSTIYDSAPADEVDPEMEVKDYTLEDEPVIYEADRLEIEDVDDGSMTSAMDWEPVFFEFDKATLSDPAKDSLNEYSKILMGNRNLIVLLEGHCDNRGTEEYNMALGERRAQQVKRYLLQLGVRSNQLRTISYGELRPQDADDNESAWARNRRVSFTF